MTKFIMKSITKTKIIAHESLRQSSLKGAYFPLIRPNEQATDKFTVPSIFKTPYAHPEQMLRISFINSEIPYEFICLTMTLITRKSDKKHNLH